MLLYLLSCMSLNIVRFVVETGVALDLALGALFMGRKIREAHIALLTLLRKGALLWTGRTTPGGEERRGSFLERRVGWAMGGRGPCCEESTSVPGQGTVA